MSGIFRTSKSCGIFDKLSFDVLIEKIFPFISVQDLYENIRKVNSTLYESTIRYLCNPNRNFGEELLFKSNTAIPLYHLRDEYHYYLTSEYDMSTYRKVYPRMYRHHDIMKFEDLRMTDFHRSDFHPCSPNTFLQLCEMGCINLKDCGKRIIRFLIMEFLVSKGVFDSCYYDDYGTVTIPFPQNLHKGLETPKKIIQFLYDFSSLLNFRIEDEELLIELSIFNFLHSICFTIAEEVFEYILLHPHLFRIPTNEETRILFSGKSDYWSSIICLHPTFQITPKIYKEIIHLNRGSTVDLGNIFYVHETYNIPSFLFVSDRMIADVLVKSERFEEGNSKYWDNRNTEFEKHSYECNIFLDTLLLFYKFVDKYGMKITIKKDSKFYKKNERIVQDVWSDEVRNLHKWEYGMVSVISKDDNRIENNEYITEEYEDEQLDFWIWKK